MTASAKAVPTYYAVVLDCPNPMELARFYGSLLEWSAIEGEGSWVTLTGDNGIKLAFQGVSGYRPPEWPSQNQAQQEHLDFLVEDLDAGEQRALKLGARKFEEQPKPGSFRVFADPAGHPFCLCA